jgi:DNA-binding NarL/FixJ family response regulator
MIMIRLTKQQQKVAEMIWDGFSYDEIANILGITNRTVVAHRENIMLKTGEKKTILAIRKLVEIGAIEVTIE